MIKGAHGWINNFFAQIRKMYDGAQFSTKMSGEYVDGSE